jgi:hypothetical protein
VALAGIAIGVWWVHAFSKGLASIDGGAWNYVEEKGSSSSILAWVASPDRTLMEVDDAIFVLARRVKGSTPAEPHEAARCMLAVYLLVVTNHYRDIAPHQRVRVVEPVYYTLKAASGDSEIAALFELAGRMATPDLKPTWEEVAARK